ncbi:16S rRNA (cytosine(1402)-N(4))-methyltransferase RsmH [Amylibacter sp. SFDW26]|uniref:16S rRNA (cytosine(1402)-N(4))-methyltransferase RsmH n=1 Tax=Amylibacter sp. SFDW26 TaxID=2652722 RepID=UPI00126143E7|nr:16S rRNA (cytosine(1402)-N(4))-methyltransferase RsmH [Amylibacter sp. SFDW26]KAB7610342.1 16S rRNA (cytosine(1402)-N(4))-methyltransferase RsmH [Amylibacter sp. SFDW26]
MAQALDTSPSSPHIPVLLDPILEAVSPVQGRWLDGTFGAGGYTRAFLDAGAATVYAIDRDPEVFERAKVWSGDYGDRLVLISGTFGNLDKLADEAGATPLDGVVLDIGVSSMQLDQAERGFSFIQDGPLDMRMSQDGMTAADIVNAADEAVLADILYLYGEERASRRIARRIVEARKTTEFTTTKQLADVVEGALPRSKPGQAHPATRSFQALRIAVNDELGELVRGLVAAEAALGEGGLLAVVTFHSLEDRIVKRFIQARSEQARTNRYAPEAKATESQFEKVSRRAIGPSDEELEQNPRSRSAKLRVARRTAAPAGDVDAKSIGLPMFDLTRLN